MSDYQPAQPNPDLKTLDKLVGKWKVSGGAEGQITYEWMEGNFFLMQHINLQHGDLHHSGIEIIGHEMKFGEAPSEHIKSRYYGSMGFTFDYTYEMEGNLLTIWGGEKGSPAYYRGTLSDDGNTLEGAWVYPDGGGYQSTATRIQE